MKSDLEFHRVIGRKIPPEPWTRPADWLPLPEVAAGEQKFVGLYAVFPRTPILTSFVVCTPEYRVEWGDGTADNVGDTSAISHTYDYDALPAGSYCSRGYKQVIITITPRLGKNLTKINFMVNDMYKNFLDINIAGAYINELTGVRNSRFLERLNFVGLNVITSFSGLFQTDYRLKIIENLYTGQGTTFANMLNECYSIETIPTFDTSKGTNFSSMLQNCRVLRAIPSLNTALGTNFGNMAYGCTGLSEIPALNVSAGTSFSSIFNYASAITKILMTGISKTISIAYLKLPADEIVRVFNNLASGVTGQTIDITGNPGTAALTAAERSIATDKGWTITG